MCFKSPTKVEADFKLEWVRKRGGEVRVRKRQRNPKARTADIASTLPALTPLPANRPSDGTCALPPGVISNRWVCTCGKRPLTDFDACTACSRPRVIAIDPTTRTEVTIQALLSPPDVVARLQVASEQRAHTPSCHDRQATLASELAPPPPPPPPPHSTPTQTARSDFDSAPLDNGAEDDSAARKHARTSNPGRAEGVLGVSDPRECPEPVVIIREPRERSLRPRSPSPPRRRRRRPLATPPFKSATLSHSHSSERTPQGEPETARWVEQQMGRRSSCEVDWKAETKRKVRFQ